MRIDGFRVRNGDAMFGGGISITAAAPTIANNDVLGNAADMGGGIAVWGYRTIPPVAHARIDTNVIQVNRGGSGGGGIAIIGASCEVVNNVLTRNTTGGEGGGIGVWVADSAKTARPRIANNFIYENASNLTTPGMTVGGGGVYATERDVNGEPVDFGICTPRIEDNVIAANAAVECGGGIAIVNADTESAPVTNNTILGNSGSGICWGSAWPTLVNNLVVYNTWGLTQDVGNPYTAVIRSNDVYGNTVHGETTNYFQLADQTGTNGNIAVDPKLVRYGSHRMRLQPSSPCIGAGDDTVIGAGRLDIDLQARTQGTHVDIGADEADGTAWSDAPAVIRVKPGGSDGASGSSWAAAKATIGNAIGAAWTAGGGEVWVMQGTYAEHLELSAWVDVYGGFAGVEISRDARDPASHVTVVDGGGTPPVVSCGLSGYRVSGIDGFKITGGGTYTGGTTIPPPSSPAGWGGGVKCTLSSPVIRGNTITRNSLGDPNTAPFEPGQGAGVALVGSHALVISNTISDNEVLNRSSVGGGVYLEWSVGDLWYNTITTNRAPEGSGVYATASRPMLFNNWIGRNENYYLPPAYFGSRTGAVNLILCWDLDVLFNYFVSNVGATGGAIYLDQPYRGRVANNLFLGNYAWDRQLATGSEGGAIWLLIQTAPPEPVRIVGNTFSGNYATSQYAGEQGGAIAVLPLSSSAVIANNIMAFNTSGIYQRAGFATNPVLIRNDMYNGTANYVGLPAGATDMAADPRFVDRTNGNYRLQSSSPAVDAGNPTYVETTTDLDGAPRVQDGNNDGTPVIDIGAYEFSRDSDGDGTPDWLDCAPQNPNVWAAAVEVASLTLQGKSPTGLSWTAQNPGTVYDVVSGSLLDLRSRGDFADASCKWSDGTGASWSDGSANPPAGDGRYYVVRGHNVCGNGGWGAGASGARTISACP
jgi:parallel beta-helix repeat protein